MQPSLGRKFGLFVAGAALAIVMGCGDDETTGGGGANGGSPAAGGGPSGGNAAGGAAGAGGMGGQAECPAAGDDSPCVTCGKASCCEVYTVCVGDPACTACLACTETAKDPADCIGNECDIQQPTTANVFAC